MGMPVDALGWNPRALPTYDPPPPPASPEHHTQSVQFTSSPGAAAQPASRPLANFIGPLTAEQEILRSGPPPKLSMDLAAEGRSLAQEHGVGEDKEPDPRAEIIDLGRQVQDVDQQVQALASQPVDLAAAQQQVAVANDRQTQFLQQISGLTPQQLTDLQSLTDTSAATEAQSANLAAFSQATAALTGEQRGTLIDLTRASQDAQMNLRGQQIAKRIQDAKLSGDLCRTGAPQDAANEVLSLAQADGRAFVADRQRVEADRQVQDVYALAVTAEVSEKLAQPQQALLEAANYLQQNPSDPEAKTRLETASANFDTAFDSVIHPQDRQALEGFQADQAQKKTLADLLAGEANAERDFYDLRLIADGKGKDGPATPTQLQQFDLAAAQYNLTRHNRGMRDLAMRVAGATDEDEIEDLNGQLDEAMVSSLRQSSELNVQGRQFDHDQAVAAHEAWLNTPAADRKSATPIAADGGTAPAAAAPEVTPTQQAVEETSRLLDDAKKQRGELEKSLQPPPQKKSGWDYALDILSAVGEVALGAFVIAATGVTGVGIAVGGAIIADGLARGIHSGVDAARGTVTDTWQSQGLQALGASRTAANRIDTGINLLATAPAGGAGAVLMVAKSANILLRGSGVISGLMVIDGAQAQARYAIGGDAVTPWSVTQLTHAGLTPTQANYVLAVGSMVSTGGLAAAAARKGPGPVHQAFHTFDDPAAAAQGVASTSRVADWYTRNAPQDVRESVATQVLGPNAAPAEVAAFAKTLKSNPLVVLLDAGGDIIGGGSVRTNSTGKVGRDGLNNTIDRKTAELQHIAGDDGGLITQQVITAATVGVNEFTKQRSLFWQTTDPDEQGLADQGMPGEAQLKHQRVRQDAPDVLRPLINDDGFTRVQRALEPESATQPLSQAEQVKNLYAIPQKYRVNWPAQARDLIYEVQFDRPLSPLQKIVHPMSPDSYLGWVNSKINPSRHLVNAWEKITGRTPEEPRTLRPVTPPPGKTGQTREVTVYPPGTMSRDRLESLAAEDVQVQAQFKDLMSLNREPVELRVPKTADELDGRYVIEATEVDAATGQPVTAGSAAVVLNYRGTRGIEVERFEYMADRPRPKPGEAYLANVIGPRPGGGGAAVVRAVEFAEESGARALTFVTQNHGAQIFYNKLGAHAEGTTAPKNPAIEGLTINEARFATDAGKRIYQQREAAKAGDADSRQYIDDLPEPIRQEVARAASPQALQTALDGMGTKLYDFVGQTPDGMLLVSYRIDYGVPMQGWNGIKWRAKDAGWFMQNKIWEPVASTVMRPINATIQHVSPPLKWLNEKANPYGLPKGIQASDRRAAWQNAGYAASYAVKQGWGTWKGVITDLALAQVATGNAKVVYNDDRAIRPFNGLPGSDSVAVYFPWTGTMVSLWGNGPNVRGPIGLDPTGLQPLVRASAPMTDPTGPKGAGGLLAARAVPAELNLGIRWFGTNDGVSAVSAASVRLAPAIVNLRGDVPIQSGGARGLSLVSSITGLMPSVSHAFYVGQGGVMVRNLHVTLSGSAQTSALSPAAQNAAYRAGNHWTAGSEKVSTGTGFFLTLNPAYGEPTFAPG
jgi:hypothetical protein